MGEPRPDDRDEELEPTVAFLSALESGGVVIDGDVLQIGMTTWVIHGQVDYDGESLIAGFPSFESAQRALDRLRSMPTMPTSLD